MAKLNKTILGKVSGTLGDVTFRQRNGKNYISSRPSQFRASDDPATIERRGKFKFCIKLSSLIVSIPELYLVWSSYFGKGVSVYNKLIQKNYSKVNKDSFTSRVFISPELGFGINISSSLISKTGINITVAPLTAKAQIDTSAEPSIQMFSILCFSKPASSADEPWVQVPILSTVMPLSLESPVEITVEPSSNIENLFDLYSQKQFLLCLLTLDATGSPVHWSGSAVVL